MALATARRLASQFPDATLPCPVCAAGVRAPTLDRHLRDNHQAIAPTEPPATSWVGVDRRILRRVWIIPALGVATGVALLAAGRDSESFVVPLGIGTSVAFLAVIGAALAGWFKARVSVRDDGATLRHSLGVGRVRIDAPTQLEVGSLWITRPDPLAPDEGQHKGIDTRAGTYLRLRAGRRGLTIGCRTSTDIRKHWTGWRQGKGRKAWDITLDRADFVALQYLLAERGALSVRT